MLALVASPGSSGEQSFVLPVGATITIGRTKDNDFCFAHKSLSRTHAEATSDGKRVRIVDRHSKNGIFVHGTRVETCDLVDGDNFRCGDITFLVERAGAEEGTPARPYVPSAQTLPSQFVLESAGTKPSAKALPRLPRPDDDQRYKDRLFVLIRATEILAAGGKDDSSLDELVVLAVQVLEVDRIALTTLDDDTLEIETRVLKTFVTTSMPPFSERVVDWVLDHGRPTSFADLSADRTLPIEGRASDAGIRSAIAVPIHGSDGAIGVLYADSLSRVEAFRADDLALLRALANIASAILERAALRAKRF